MKLPMMRKFLEWSLLGMLASGYLAIVAGGTLDGPSLALAGLAILLRGLATAGVFRLRLSDPVVNAAAIAYIGFFPLDYYWVSREFLSSTVHLIFFLASVLVLRASTQRDFFFVKLCAFVEIVAASVVSTGVVFLACILFFVLFAIATQVSGEIDWGLRNQKTISRSGTRGTVRRLAMFSAFVCAGVFALAGGLFIVLPRTAHAALQRLAPDRFHLPGFSNEVRLGQIGEIRQSGMAVMHARLQNVDKPMQLKWRGSALAQFDGQRWYNEPAGVERIRVDNGLARLGAFQPYWRQWQRISYEVQLNNVTSDVLFFAGAPAQISIDATYVLRTGVDGYRISGGLGVGARYQADGFLALHGPEPHPGLQRLPEHLREYYTRRPQLDRRVVELALQVTEGFTAKLDKARELERHLRISYGYTTQLLDQPVDDPLAHFLFVRRKGHCEYFASSMAILLRTIGIPSRVATGFQSGTYNPYTGWYLIRASDAHSWVEAWIDGYGWITFDPTPPDPATPQVTLAQQLGLYLDAMEVFWQEWVMSYDLQRQVMLAGRLEQRSRSFTMDWLERWSDWKEWWRTVGRRKAPDVIAGAVLTVGAAMGIWVFAPKLAAWWRRRQRVKKVKSGTAVKSDATLLYDRMLAVFERRGIAKPGWMTPKEFTQMIPELEAASLARQFTDEYNALRFGGRAGAARRMVGLLERLEG